MKELLTLTAVALPFVITPGASFTLTLAHAHTPNTRSQSSAWRRVALGTAAGIALLALAVGATGLGTAVTANPVLRLALGLAGATVLIGLGVTVLVRAIRRSPDPEDPPASRNLVRWSFAAVMTNPKALSLYALIVPTLAGPDLHGIALFVSFAALHIGLLTIWLCLAHHAVTRIPVLVRSPRLQDLLLAAAGALMVGLGLLTATHTVAQR